MPYKIYKEDEKDSLTLIDYSDCTTAGDIYASVNTIYRYLTQELRREEST